jgi:hypothetical protein
VRRLAATAALGALLVVGLTACDPQPASTVTRPTTPVVLTGSKVPSLVGTAPDRIVAFRHSVVGGEGAWTQIPVQVDQRKVVPFGTEPASNATPGVPGTVYGSGSGGPTVLVYADPNTWVGADPNAKVDSDDEITFMVSDGGGQAPADGADPAGVVPGSGVAVQFDDPRVDGQRGWAYLYASTGSLDPAAGKDYVDYAFAPTAGAYKTTYKRSDGPNPETSAVVTPSYRIDFTDRWKETSWKVTAGSATGVDVLDGHKNQFDPNYCGRSNATFADAEGAFIANIDGPVRAIRSYVGANSGPRTQRTHIMYRDTEVVVTYLRVHAIPGIMDFLDLSAAASGMTYRSSAVPSGKAVDGADDAVGTTFPTWEAYDGAQGRIFTSNTFSTSVGGLAGATEEYYRDQATAAEAQCWGDASLYGASGAWIRKGIPSTDPIGSGAATLTAKRVTLFAAPAGAPSKVAPYAADWSADLKSPLKVTTTPYQP